MEQKQIILTITECGNGFPDDGEIIGHYGDRGDVVCWRVIEGIGPIHTSGSGSGNWIRVRAEEMDPDDDDVIDSIDVDADDLGLRPLSIESEQ